MKIVFKKKLSGWMNNTFHYISNTLSITHVNMTRQKNTNAEQQNRCEGIILKHSLTAWTSHLFPVQLLYIHQDSHEFRNRQSRMSIIQLNRHLREWFWNRYSSQEQKPLLFLHLWLKIQSINVFHVI